METLFLFILSMLAVESADSICSLYRHFLLGITDKSLNAFYYVCSYVKIECSRFMTVPASMVRQVMPEFNTKKNVIILCDSWYAKRILSASWMNYFQTWMLSVMPGVILSFMTLRHIRPDGGEGRQSMAGVFPLSLTLPFLPERLEITIGARPPCPYKYFWRKKSSGICNIVGTGRQLRALIFQYRLSRTATDFLCMVGKSTAEPDRKRTHAAHLIHSTGI